MRNNVEGKEKEGRGDGTMEQRDGSILHRELIELLVVFTANVMVSSASLSHLLCRLCDTVMLTIGQEEVLPVWGTTKDFDERRDSEKSCDHRLRYRTPCMRSCIRLGRLYQDWSINRGTNELDESVSRTFVAVCDCTSHLSHILVISSTWKFFTL